MGNFGIFGGTFNPVHWGHLIVAETALTQASLDRILWVPTHSPSYKSPDVLLSYEQRQFLVQGAIADHPHFRLSPIGGDRSIQTLQSLQSLYLNNDWYWIIGLDSFQTLPHWYQRATLIPACQWLVAPRPGITTNNSSFALEQAIAQINQQDISIRASLLSMPDIGISSSLIRQYCQEKRSLRYLVPESVRSAIATDNLYTKP